MVMISMNSSTENPNEEVGCGHWREVGRERQAGKGKRKNTVGGKNRMSGGSNLERSGREMKVTASAGNSWTHFYWEEI